MFVATRFHRAALASATAALLAVSAPCVAQGADQLWEVTVQMEMPGMPMAMAPQVRRVCVAQNHKDEDLIPVQGNCRVLDSKRADPVVPQKQRGGHAHEASADDQDRHFKVGHIWKKQYTGGSPNNYSNNSICPR